MAKFIRLNKGALNLDHVDLIHTIDDSKVVFVTQSGKEISVTVTDQNADGLLDDILTAMASDEVKILDTRGEKQ